jgi:HD-GYP domain-containing protein (c-di-GMP phosphodiesterase class II)
MLDLFANQAAMAVENARLFRETSQRAQQAAVLAEVSRDISESLRLDLTMQRIASYAQELLRARTCAVYLPEPGTLTLRAIAALGPYAQEIKDDPLTLGDGILGSIALQRSGEIVNNVGGDPRAIHIEGTEALPIEHLMGVPVLTKDQLTGLIAVWRIGAGQEFDSGELDFLTNLAGQVGVAIENARLFEGTRRRLLETEGLHVVSTALRSAHTIDEALPIILEQLMSLLSAGGASLQMQDPATGEIVIRLAMGAWESATGMRTPPDAGVTGQVFMTGQPYVSDDIVRTGKLYLPDLFTSLPAAACVPVIAQHQPIGVLWIGRRAPILDEEMNLLSAIGEMIGNAIHRMMLNEETERRADEFESLYRSANGLASQWDLQTVLKTVVTQAMELLNSSGSDVYLFDPERGDLVIVVETGGILHIGSRMRVDEGMAGRVFRNQQPLIVDDYRVWEGRSPQYYDLAVSAVVEVPVTFAGEKIGVLAAYEVASSNRKYTDADARLLSLFATQAASAIRNARLLAELRGATSELSMAYDTTLEGWARALELRDKETLGHSRRVTEMTLRLARRLSVPESELTHMRRGVLLHDIGKMGIPDNLLKKTGPLSEDEWTEMRRHPNYARELLYPISYLRPALEIPYCHHERWDGSGYPRGLKGEQIPLAARIFMVVDVYDALSYDRPYRAAWPRHQVLNYLRTQSGRLFDPRVVEAFLGLFEETDLPAAEPHPAA